MNMFWKLSSFTWKDIIARITFSPFEDYIYYAIMIIALFIGYLFARPITRWLISLRSVRLLSYLLNSLLILFTMIFMIVLIEELNHSLTYLFRIFLQCLAVFGIVLIIYKLFWGKQKKRSNY